jgi:two-component system, NarL family, nitrate/nitrite response regulator NarL
MTDQRYQPYKVMVVDDRTMPRIAAKAMLSGAGDLKYVGEASSGAEALRLVEQLKPDVVLMDVEMEGMDGAETTSSLLKNHSGLVIVAWTVSDVGDDLLRMIQAGCAGYVLKDVGPDELHRALRAAIRGEAPVPRRMLPEVLRRAARQAPRGMKSDVGLTDREHEALRLLAKGLPTKRMAIQMGISTASVDTHLKNVYRKLGVNNRGEAVNVGLRLGLLSISDL